METYSKSNSRRAGKSHRGLTFAATVSIALVATLGQVGAGADEFDDLLNVLKAKGVLSEQEFESEMEAI